MKKMYQYEKLLANTEKKEMKRDFSKILYNQRNKDETIVSVIKRLFGEHISSRLIRIQNREVTLRCIIYNLNRMLNLIIFNWILQILFHPLISNKCNIFTNKVKINLDLLKNISTILL